MTGVTCNQLGSFIRFWSDRIDQMLYVFGKNTMASHLYLVARCSPIRFRHSRDLCVSNASRTIVADSRRRRDTNQRRRRSFKVFRRGKSGSMQIGVVLSARGPVGLGPAHLQSHNGKRDIFVEICFDF